MSSVSSAGDADRDGRITVEVWRVEARLDAAPGPADSPDDAALTDEELRGFERAARDPLAPPELRLLARKVDAGAFTWRDIAEGRCFDDPEIRAAFPDAPTSDAPTSEPPTPDARGPDASAQQDPSTRAPDPPAAVRRRLDDTADGEYFVDEILEDI